MNNRRRMKRKALRLYRSINMTKNRRVYSETLVRTLLKEYKKKHEDRDPSYIPSIYSFQKQYPPDSLGKYERL